MAQPNDPVFNRAMAKAAAHLLSLAGDEFGNHGCNDFDLIAADRATAASPSSSDTQAHDAKEKP